MFFVNVIRNHQDIFRTQGIHSENYISYSFDLKKAGSLAL